MCSYLSCDCSYELGLEVDLSWFHHSGTLLQHRLGSYPGSFPVLQVITADLVKMDMGSRLESVQNRVNQAKLPISTSTLLRAPTILPLLPCARTSDLQTLSQPARSPYFAPAVNFFFSFHRSYF